PIASQEYLPACSWCLFIGEQQEDFTGPDRLASQLKTLDTPAFTIDDKFALIKIFLQVGDTERRDFAFTHKRRRSLCLHVNEGMRRHARPVGIINGSQCMTLPLRADRRRIGRDRTGIDRIEQTVLPNTHDVVISATLARLPASSKYPSSALSGFSDRTVQ